MVAVRRLFGRCQRRRSACSLSATFDTPGGPSIVIVMSGPAAVVSVSRRGRPRPALGRSGRRQPRSGQDAGTGVSRRRYHRRMASHARLSHAISSRQAPLVTRQRRRRGGRRRRAHRRAVDDQHRHGRHRGNRRASAPPRPRRLRARAHHGRSRRGRQGRAAHPRPAGAAGVQRAAGRRLPLQRPHAAGREPRLRRSARQVSHQSRQRRLQGQEATASSRAIIDMRCSTPSRCASASTGAASTRSC